jgi:hypothetical protein
LPELIKEQAAKWNYDMQIARNCHRGQGQLVLRQSKPYAKMRLNGWLNDTGIYAAWL